MTEFSKSKFANNQKLHDRLVEEAAKFRLILIGHSTDTRRRRYRCVRCGREYEYPTSVVRKQIGRSCRECKFEEQSDRKPNFRDELPTLSKMWNYEKNGVNPPEFYPPSAHVFAWFKCPEGHEFNANLNHLYNRKNKNSLGWESCIECNKSNVGEYVSKAKAKNSISFAEKYPQLLSEWDYDRNTRSPFEISYGSKVKINFICEFGHRWISTPNSRSINNCPKCNHSSTSKIEVRIYSELKSVFDDVLWRKKYQGTEIDVFLPELKIGIEYDGKYWHSQKEEQDLNKLKLLKKIGIKLIRIREAPLKRVGEFDILLDPNQSEQLIIKRLFEAIYQMTLSTEAQQYLNKFDDSKTFSNEALFQDIVQIFPKPLPEDSLLNTRPDIAAKWDYQKNGSFTPDMFTVGSGFRAWWICQSGHPPFQEKINNMRSRGYSCGICYEEDRARLVRRGRMKKGVNLAFKRPDLKKFYLKHNKDWKFEDLSAGSKYKCLWSCSDCGAEFSAVVRDVVRRENPPLCRNCTYRARGLAISSAMKRK